MKKNFEAPKMSISIFEAENVLTASGDIQAVNNVQNGFAAQAQKAGIDMNAVKAVLTF